MRAYCGFLLLAALGATPGLAQLQDNPICVFDFVPPLGIVDVNEIATLLVNWECPASECPELTSIFNTPAVGISAIATLLVGWGACEEPLEAPHVECTTESCIMGAARITPGGQIDPVESVASARPGDVRVFSPPIQLANVITLAAGTSRVDIEFIPQVYLDSLYLFNVPPGAGVSTEPPLSFLSGFPSRVIEGSGTLTLKPRRPLYRLAITLEQPASAPISLLVGTAESPQLYCQCMGLAEVPVSICPLCESDEFTQAPVVPGDNVVLVCLCSGADGIPAPVSICGLPNCIGAPFNTTLPP